MFEKPLSPPTSILSTSPKSIPPSAGFTSQLSRSASSAEQKDVVPLRTPPAEPLWEGGKLLSANEFEQLVRGYQEGRGGRYLYCSISLQEYKKFRARIKPPTDDPLRGYWKDKFRYDYDSQSKLFGILMGADSVHESFLFAIAWQINMYLHRLQQTENPAIKDFASAIEGKRSTMIKYKSQEDPDYVPSTALASSTARRTIPVGTRSRAHQTRGHSSGKAAASNPPSYQVEEEDPDTSDSIPPNSDWKENYYSPDDSWRFDSAKAWDKRAAFALEVSDTERIKHLEGKIRGLIGTCNTQAVLACIVVEYKGRGPCIELWRPQWQYGEEQPAVPEPKMAWRVNLLTEGGEARTETDPQAQIDLFHFITEASLEKHFDQDPDGSDFKMFEEHEPLKLDIVDLSQKLVKFRKKQKEEQEEEKLERLKRTRAGDEADNGNGGSQVSPRRKRIRESFKSRLPH